MIKIGVPTMGYSVWSQNIQDDLADHPTLLRRPIMSRVIKINVMTGLMLILFASVAHGQEPRPTPTNVPQIASQDSEDRGTIQGLVYQDVNGDGRCINTGIAGEGPVEGIPIEFVSSDEETVITLYSGPEGIYGLYAAGQSYWSVTAKPGPEWIVTSQATLFAPIFEDSQAQTGVNFCVGKTTSQGQARVVAILPTAGSPGSPGLVVAAGLGLLLVLTGLALQWHERRQRVRR
jgi:hypothetical protein